MIDSGVDLSHAGVRRPAEHDAAEHADLHVEQRGGARHRHRPRSSARPSNGIGIGRHLPAGEAPALGREPGRRARPSATRSAASPRQRRRAAASSTSASAASTGSRSRSTRSCAPSAAARWSSPRPGTTARIGSPPSYPAELAHVLTVGATDEQDRATVFSSTSSQAWTSPRRARTSRSPCRDLYPTPTRLRRRSTGRASRRRSSPARPPPSGRCGPTPDEHAALRGDAPLGARRRQAAAGTADTGFGILDIAGGADAQGAAAPTRRSRTRTSTSSSRTGSSRRGKPPLTAPGRPTRDASRRTSSAHEDPEDVYRVWPARARASSSSPWRPNGERRPRGLGPADAGPSSSAARRRGATCSASPPIRGSEDRARRRSRTAGTGQYVYADVFLGKKSAAGQRTRSASRPLDASRGVLDRRCRAAPRACARARARARPGSARAARRRRRRRASRAAWNCRASETSRTSSTTSR